MDCHMARVFQAAQSTFRPISESFFYCLSYSQLVMMSGSLFSHRGSKKMEERLGGATGFSTHDFLLCPEAGGVPSVVWCLKGACKLMGTCPRRQDWAVRSPVRQDCPDLEALCLRPFGTCECPQVPTQASLSWCGLQTCPCALMPREPCCYGKIGVVPALPWW